MSEPLRPSSLGEILDRTAQLYRTRFLLFLGISILPTGVMVALACVVGLVVAWWSAAGARTVSESAGYALLAVFWIAVVLVALPVFLAVTALAMAAMNHAAGRIYLGETRPGERATIRDAYRSVWPQGWRYLGLYLLEALIVGVVPAVVWTVMVLLAAGGAVWARKMGVDTASAGVLLGLGAVVVAVGLVGYFFWMLLRIALAFPACVTEQISPWRAIKRSFALSHGTKGRLFVLFLLGATLSYLLTIMVILLLTILVYLIPGVSNVQHQQTMGIVFLFIVYGAGFAMQALVKPVYGIALVLFYYDQRIRHEGFDIEWMMRKAGMVPEPPAQPEAAPWLPAAPRKTEAAQALDIAADASPMAKETPRPGEPA